MTKHYGSLIAGEKMKLAKKYVWTSFIILGLIGLGKTVLDEIKMGASAYLFGYPLVLMDETRKETVAHIGSNRLSHSINFPNSDFRLLARPNVDTLYSTAWLDLSQGPLVVSMPDTGDRYYVLPFMDAWTNVFARRGTNETGNTAQEIAIVGPEFKGDIPAHIDSVVKSPTNMVWLIGRIQTNSAADVINVAKIQEKMSLTPLDKWRIGERYKGEARSLMDNAQSDVSKWVDNMSTGAFFAKMNALMEKQAPFAEDVSELNKFSHLNIGPNMNFKLDSLNIIERWAVQKSVALTIEKITQAVNAKEANKQGWNIMRNLGTYGTDYKLRAGIARFGLGALPSVEAVYPSSSVDSSGQPYHGKNNYVLHFEANELPPVNAFWSLSMYNKDGFFVDNEIDRYAIGDRSELQFNQDGSLDIYIQHKKPLYDSVNWLPAPGNKFNLLLRLYIPKKVFFNESWHIPAVRQIENQ